MEVSTLSGLMNLSNIVSAVGILIIVAWWLEKRMRGLEDKHDKEKNALKAEYNAILQAIRHESNENLKAQREAHRQEKDEFFGGLKNLISELVKELQTAEKTRIRMLETLSTIGNFQNEVRNQLTQYDADLIEIKETLRVNSMILKTSLKCDLDERNNHEFKREFENPRGF